MMPTGDDAASERNRSSELASSEVRRTTRSRARCRPRVSTATRLTSMAVISRPTAPTAIPCWTGDQPPARGGPLTRISHCPSALTRRSWWRADGDWRGAGGRRRLAGAGEPDDPRAGVPHQLAQPLLVRALHLGLVVVLAGEGHAEA